MKPTEWYDETRDKWVHVDDPPNYELEDLKDYIAGTLTVAFLIVWALL